jgi:hypothetical protein
MFVKSLFLRFRHPSTAVQFYFSYSLSISLSKSLIWREILRHFLFLKKKVIYLSQRSFLIARILKIVEVAFKAFLKNFINEMMLQLNSKTQLNCVSKIKKQAKIVKHLEVFGKKWQKYISICANI